MADSLAQSYPGYDGPCPGETRLPLASGLAETYDSEPKWRFDVVARRQYYETIVLKLIFRAGEHAISDMIMIMIMT